MMPRVLLVSQNSKDRDGLCAFLTDEGFEQITFTQENQETEDVFSAADEFQLCVINSPLDEADCEKLAEKAQKILCCPVILTVDASKADSVGKRLEKLGILIVPKPVFRIVFLQAVRLAMTYQRQEEKFEEEKNKIKQKLEDMQLVDRAKWVLVQYLSMTENQAHKFIEKQAMDLGLKKTEIALRILKTYG